MNGPEDQRKRRDRRPLGLIALIGGTIAAACLIGFGGLAAWTVTTQNAGNAFAAGSVHHTNLAKLNGAGVGTSCTDQAGVCGVIFTLPNAKPGSSVSGTVQITNNAGSLPSTFSLSLSSSSGALCASLNASITDDETTPQNFYNGTLSAMGAQSLKSSAGNASWPAGDTGTYTFTITLPASSATTDMGQTCTAAYTWTQTNS